jgi:hypothetical protein
VKQGRAPRRIFDPSGSGYFERGGHSIARNYFSQPSYCRCSCVASVFFLDFQSPAQNRTRCIKKDAGL